MLKDNKNQFTPPLTRLVWIYSMENKGLFKEIKKAIPKSRFIKGFAEVEGELLAGTLFPKRKPDDHYMVILDDCNTYTCVCVCVGDIHSCLYLSDG